MTDFFRMRPALAAITLCLGLGLSLVAAPSAAEPVQQGTLTIEEPWARASIADAPNSAAYMRIKNTGESPDRLLAAASPVATRVEVHEHIHDDGVMRMREVEGGIALPAGEVTELKPGGYHVMLIGLKERLEAGDRVPLTLTFQTAGSVAVSAEVRGR